ncbi:hypothetical protein PHLCEN_2v8861 [Hermanssonia centrifuga]|uniref:Uncharacterized protein n=1 Tax=Hermanssonia centrifuga TaxID=98765 RepID=A0A2R6NSG6_9APHY|nr:hypothetical protein PHLCEN_2v8861 [Hermanssonia centrifuga]
MPATPSKAKFLTAKEKQYIGDVLREDGVIARADQDNSFDWAQVLKVFTQPHVLLLAIAAFFSGEYRGLNFMHTVL